MDTIFTFPRKKPQYLNISQLKKTCTFLDISHQDNKKQLIKNVNNCYMDGYLLHRIEIHFKQDYYISTLHRYYKSFIKTYEDVNREDYILTSTNGKLSYNVRYDKIKHQWDVETNFKVQKNTKVIFGIEKELPRLRSIIGYLELQYIYMIFYHQTILIKDVFNYIMYHYKTILQLPHQCYRIL